MEKEIKEGIVKCNAFTFEPVIRYKTKNRIRESDFVRINKKQHKLALDFLGEKIKYTTKEIKGQDVATIVINI